MATAGRKAARPNTVVVPLSAPKARGVALAVAFISGWSLMMLEILSARMLAPYFGYSIYQWGALIGVVLGFMSLGYFVGGRFGDQSEAYRLLTAALTASFVWVLLTPKMSGSLVAPMRSLGPIMGALAASTLLLAVPSLLLAVVSPVVIRLALREGVASAAGTVYGVSTIGSIGGTFFAAFYAIPEIGSHASYYVTAGLLFIAIAGLAWLRDKASILVVSAAAWLSLLIPGQRDLSSVVYETESAYNIIRVEDTATARLLFLNYREGPQTLLPHEGILTGFYYDYFLLGPLLSGGQNVLGLGVAGGVALRQITAVWPKAEVIGVELDPAVIQTAQNLFGLRSEPRIKLVADDARWYLAGSGRRFDEAAVDLYVTGEIPFYCTTVEFFKLVAQHLTDRGVLMMNVLSAQPGDGLVGPMVRTMRQAFPSVFVLGQGNFVVLALKAPMTLEEVRDRLRSSSDPIVSTVAARALATLRELPHDAEWPLFTDDRNDVEFRSFRMFYGPPYSNPR